MKSEVLRGLFLSAAADREEKITSTLATIADMRLMRKSLSRKDAHLNAVEIRQLKASIEEWKLERDMALEAAKRF